MLINKYLSQLKLQMQKSDNNGKSQYNFVNFNVGLFKNFVCWPEINIWKIKNSVDLTANLKRLNSSRCSNIGFILYKRF